LTTPSDVLLGRHRRLSLWSRVATEDATTPGLRSRGRSRTGPGALFQPGLQGDGVPPRCSGEQTPTTVLQKEGHPGGRVTDPQTTPRLRTRGASGRGVCVDVPTLPRRRSLNNAPGPSGVTGPSLPVCCSGPRPRRASAPLAPGAVVPGPGRSGSTRSRRPMATARARAGAPDHRPHQGTPSPPPALRTQPRRSTNRKAPACCLPGATSGGRHVPAPISKSKRLLHCPQGGKPCPDAYRPGAWLAGPPAKSAPGTPDRRSPAGELEATLQQALRKLQQAVAEAADDPALPDDKEPSSFRRGPSA
jgi:hypothetical protein